MSTKGGKRTGAGRKPKHGVKLVAVIVYVTPVVKEKLKNMCLITKRTIGEFLTEIVGGQ